MAESDSPTSYLSDSPQSPAEHYSGGRQHLVSIIKRSDLLQLRQFIASNPPEAVIAPGEPYLADTLFIAAAYGSPEALRLILEVHQGAPEVVQRFNPKFNMLFDACGATNIDVVRSILDTHHRPENRMPLGTIDLHRRDDYGDTPIIVAAGSMMYLDENAFDEDDDGLYLSSRFQDRVTRGHQLIHLLLDRGCLATDVVPPLPDRPFAGESQVRDSVLGLAVSRADGPLIQRLIDSGADIYLRHQHYHNIHVPLQYTSTKPGAYDVTSLHQGSLFYNPDAVKLLLEHQRHQNSANPDLASTRDSNGRLPLHWAASGPGQFNCRILDQQLKITETLRLLLDHDSTGINLVDHTGTTPLHYAVVSHTKCGCIQHAESAIRALLEYGADPCIPDSSGRTILHLLGYHSHQVDPLPTTFLDWILSSGVDIHHAENNGKTALHVFARNLRQVSAAKLLIRQGADIRARDTSWETPFHAAARGFLSFHVASGRDTDLTAETKTRLQDEIMGALQEAAGEDVAMLMSQPNMEGKTPRDLLEISRSRWQAIRKRPTGVGRGRGWGWSGGKPPGV